ncbi:TetR/AcrR family transcriptional regulator [Nocardia sp. NBC_00511]|uniref:TetR/AcrR family transcriptional regulator n=1 Tax=Nocardia sp. NBC_00511 TaxID=2903591 RepID=UPI0030E2C27D
MNATSRQRSTRDRPAKAPLSEAGVVDTALALLQAEGLGAVTMRRVATALDTGPSSLYVYVSGRESLIHAMQDRVFATVELETPDPARWREQLHSLLTRLRQALADHPGIAATIIAEAPGTEATLLYTENLLGILLAGGLDPQDAAWATDIFAVVVTHAAAEADARRTGSAEQADTNRRTFAGVSPERFPLITAHADRLVAGDAEQRFRVTVDVVIDGLLARTKNAGPHTVR